MTKGNRHTLVQVFGDWEEDNEYSKVHPAKWTYQQANTLQHKPVDLKQSSLTPTLKTGQWAPQHQLKQFKVIFRPKFLLPYPIGFQKFDVQHKSTLSRNTLVCSKVTKRIFQVLIKYCTSIFIVREFQNNQKILGSWTFPIPQLFLGISLSTWSWSIYSCHKTWLCQIWLTFNNHYDLN